jgi:hypothetical protein
MAMTRERIQEQMLEYLYEELSPVECAAFEAAILEHPDLQAELGELQETRAGLPSVSQELPVSRSVRDAVLSEAAEVASRRRREAPSLWERFLAGWNQPALASALTLVLVAGVGLYVVDFIPDNAPGEGERVLEPARPVAVAPEVLDGLAELELAEELEEGAFADEPIGGVAAAPEKVPEIALEKAAAPVATKKASAPVKKKATLHAQSDRKTKRPVSKKASNAKQELRVSKVPRARRKEAEVAPADAVQRSVLSQANGFGKETGAAPERKARGLSKLGSAQSVTSGKGGLAKSGAAGMAPIQSAPSALPPPQAALGESAPAPAAAELDEAEAPQEAPPFREEDADWVIGDDAKTELARRMARLVRQSPGERSKRALEVALDLAEEVADWDRMKRLIEWLEEAHGVEAGRSWRRILRRR